MGHCLLYAFIVTESLRILVTKILSNACAQITPWTEQVAVLPLDRTEPALWCAVCLSSLPSPRHPPPINLSFPLGSSPYSIITPSSTFQGALLLPGKTMFNEPHWPSPPVILQGKSLYTVCPNATVLQMTFRPWLLPSADIEPGCKGLAIEAKLSSTENQKADTAITGPSWWAHPVPLFLCAPFI